MRASIYHGGEVLCDVANSQEVMMANGVATWDEEISFKIRLADLPRMARICFLLYALSDRRTKDKKGNTTGGGKKNRHRQVQLILLIVQLGDIVYY